jgi:hypothetical protein
LTKKEPDEQKGSTFNQADQGTDCGAFRESHQKRHNWTWRWSAGWLSIVVAKPNKDANANPRHHTADDATLQTVSSLTYFQSGRNKRPEKDGNNRSLHKQSQVACAEADGGHYRSS